MASTTITNGNWDIGPGIDKAKQTDAFNKRAVRGFTPTEMNAEVMQRAKIHLLK